MGIRFSHFISLIGTLLLIVSLRSASADTYVRFNTNLGNIDVDLFSSTPNTTANFMSYVSSGAYTNVVINRSVSNFVLQGGAYTISGNSLNTVTLDNNYTTNPLLSEAGISNTRGTIAMALSSGPNTGTDQWFFNEVNNNSSTALANLDNSSDGGPFTVFGKIMNTSSLSVMDQIGALQILDFSSDFGADFSALPVYDYSSTVGLEASNLVVISSITTLTGVVGFSDWQTGPDSQFTSPQQSNPAFIAPAAMPFNDGVPNLLKYVCDINPSVPMTSTALARLPVVGSTTISSTKYLTLTYHQHNALVGVNVNVETSPDMVTWTTASNPTFVQTGTDSSGDPIVQIQVAATGTAQFIRLNVVQP